MNLEFDKHITASGSGPSTTAMDAAEVVVGVSILVVLLFVGLGLYCAERLTRLVSGK